MQPINFERTLGYNWDMIPKDRSLDPDKIDAYLSQLQPEDCVFVGDLLKVTSYIPYAEMKLNLLKSLEQFKQQIGETPFYIFMPTYKIGSEHWITALLWPQLRQLNIQGFVNRTSDICLPATVVVVDDAIYSGNNILMKMDEWSYNLKEKHNTTQSQILSQMYWHFVIPYTSTTGITSLNEFFKENQTQGIIHAVKQMPRLNELLNLEDYYTGDIFQILLQKFGIEGTDHPPVYFDHKVAAICSTFPTIYLEGRIPGGVFEKDVSADVPGLVTLSGNPIESPPQHYGALLKVLPSREKIMEVGALLVDS